jgi:hypothetical protein
MNKHLKRLVEEWKQHGRIIVAVDYDDTISPWKATTQQDCDEVIKLLKEVRNVGAYIVIFTCSDVDRYKEIEEYCKSKELKIDSINQNPISLPYGNQNKVYANIFIDDRAGLYESLNLLEEAMYQQRAELNKGKQMYDF